MIDEKRYELVAKNNPVEARIWKAAAESFPDEALREYFVKYENFSSFYDRMMNFYSHEEVRFWKMFTICPELKKVAKSTNDRATSEIEWWAVKNDWR